MRKLETGLTINRRTDLPPVKDQLSAISRWFVAFGGRRPSEAAMECADMMTKQKARRRQLFTALRTLGCIELRNGEWVAVKAQPATEPVTEDGR